ncbi:pyridoxamine 5'-phosphate oxidase family protein [Pararhodobacter sp.]|uniref:pyridoxamine 5'-phosphate oxidase family protein n=1 Tax=Pararhodobacter sp. TaxID=2127056 RepID=UPI002FDEDE8F
MHWIDSEEGLAALYNAPPEAAVVKVARRLTPAYESWIARSRFCLLSTVGPEGTDCSPRGDDRPVVQVPDPGTLLLPDWRGNNRIDSLRNIVRDGRLSLAFMVAGSNTVMRVNGRGRLSTDPELLARFEREGTLPKLVIVVALDEVYSQCARALIRSRLWRDGDCAEGLPSVGQMLAEITEGAINGAAYDAEWPGRAAKTMW